MRGRLWRGRDHDQLQFGRLLWSRGQSRAHSLSWERGVSTFDRSMTVLMVAAAVVTAAAVADRALASRASITATDEGGPARALDPGLWDEVRTTGRVLEIGSGSQEVVVFSDYECPSCRAFHEMLVSSGPEVRDRIRVLLVHWPLSYHRFARPAAQAAECIAASGGFTTFTEIVFRLQDSLGLLSWSEIARRAGAEDPAAVEDCARGSSSDPRFASITAGIRLAKAVGGTGTPTVVLEGWILPTIPDMEHLAELLDAVARKSPP
jgi:protein-disulfide isomerase